MFEILNTIGLISFAFSGAVKGITKKLDFFGISVVGISTALGGGVLRDLLVNRLPLMFIHPSNIIFSFLGILLAIAIRSNITKFIEKTFLVSDTIGLASFTASGCIVGWENSIGPVGIVLLGLLTAIGGGIIRDILTGEVPLILRKEFYATCSIIGGVSFYFLALCFPLFFSSMICVFIVFILRTLALKFNWHLPHF